MPKTIEGLVAYLKARLIERSTWQAIGLGFGGAAASPAPLSYFIAGAGVIAALVPDGSIHQ
jgi:hypothetical protein